MDIIYSELLAIPIREPPNSLILIVLGSAVRALVY